MASSCFPSWREKNERLKKWIKALQSLIKLNVAKLERILQPRDLFAQGGALCICVCVPQLSAWGTTCFAREQLHGCLFAKTSGPIFLEAAAYFDWNRATRGTATLYKYRITHWRLHANSKERCGPPPERKKAAQCAILWKLASWKSARLLNQTSAIAIWLI